jgi:hypothetical protein
MEVLTCPSQRAVYKKFHTEGYSTGYDREPRFHHTESPGSIEAGVTPVSHESCYVTSFEETAAGDEICEPIKDDIQIAASKISDTLTTPTLPRRFHHDDNYGYQTLSQAQSEPVNKNPAALGLLDPTRLTEGLTLVDAVNDVRTSNGSPPEKSKVGQTRHRKKRNIQNIREQDTSDQEQIIQNLQILGFLDSSQHRRGPQHGGGRTKHPHRIKEGSDHMTDYHAFLESSHQVDLQGPKSGQHAVTFTSHSRPIGKLRALFGTKTPAKLWSDKDSGYSSQYSGRVTPSTLHLRDSLVSYPESLTEFQGLYKVTCSTIHEPRVPEQYNELQSCHFCGYSSIHNVAWSAARLKLQEFQAKLRSKNVYDFQALDKAGNSALHYAAASGGSFDHLKALIDVGVPHYKRNTANQHFLHCLRPCDAGSENYSPDCFELGLIDLLKLVEPKIAFSQQDNDGQTVLHALALHIIKPELREQTFK